MKQTEEFRRKAPLGNSRALIGEGKALIAEEVALIENSDGHHHHELQGTWIDLYVRCQM